MIAHLPNGTVVQALENNYTPTGNIGVITDCISIPPSDRARLGEYDYAVLMPRSGHIYLYGHEFTVLAPPATIEVGQRVRFYSEFNFKVGTVIRCYSYSSNVDIQFDIENGTKTQRIDRTKIIPLRIPGDKNNGYRDMLDI